MHIKKFNDSQLHFISKMIDIGYNNKTILKLFKKEFNEETISTYITQVRRGQQGKDIGQNYKFAIDGNYPTYYEWIEYLIDNDIYYGTKFEEFGNYIKNKIEKDDLFLITKSNTFELIAYLQETDNGFKIVKSVDDKTIDEKFTHNVELKVDNMYKVNLENKNSHILINIDISDKYLVLLYILLYSIKGMNSIIDYHLYNNKD